MYINVASDKDAFNLSNLMKSGDWMVLYYAEWCGYCKTMKPEWKNVVEKLNNPQINTKNINTAEVESSHIGKLLNKPVIDGYPTIKMYNNGKEIAKFNDDRIASKIEAFANNNASKKSGKSGKSSKLNIPLSTLSNIEAQPVESQPIEAQPVEEPKELNMNNLIMKFNNKIKSNNNLQLPQSEEQEQQPKINILDLPCSSIIRAKPCKTNPKCMYDGSDRKCKDRIFTKPYKTNIINTNTNIKNKSQNIIGNIIFKNNKSMSKTTPRGKSRSKITLRKKTKAKTTYKGKSKRSKNNIKKTTKSVFNQLIKSFERIGDETQKDSKLLKKASNKL